MTYPSNSPLLRNDTKRRLIDIGRMHLVLKLATWSSYYVGIFWQLVHVTNLITKNWVRSELLTSQPRSFPSCSSITLPNSQCLPCISSWALPSILNSRKKHQAATPCGIGNRGWVWSRDHSRLVQEPTKSPVSSLVERISHFWGHMGAYKKFTQCPRCGSWFSSPISSQTHTFLKSALKGRIMSWTSTWILPLGSCIYIFLLEKL